ncbi:hypothetical protein FQA39_LY06017 [Lamprigera yunnana]|nr:hypothetical protein FQA39_LY06017 [Lamprigera yunnana]
MSNSEIKEALQKFEYFKKWTDDVVAECCTLAKIKKYSNDKIILGDSIGFPNYVHFVLKGECKLIEELYVSKFTVNNIVRYKLCKPKADGFERFITEEITTADVNQSGNRSNAIDEPKSFQKKKAQNLEEEVHFIQVAIFSKLSSFGFGESMERRSMVTTSSVECLLIPCYWLMQHNINNIWNKLKLFLKKHVPTTEQVFKKFVNERMWIKHRQRLAYDIVSKKQLSSNNYITNVPYFIRINDI